MNEIKAELTTAKTHVMLNGHETTVDNVEQIQGLITHALSCADDNDKEALESTLDAIDAIKVPGWDLTSGARAKL